MARPSFSESSIPVQRNRTKILLAISISCASDKMRLADFLADRFLEFFGPAFECAELIRDILERHLQIQLN
jgi:hypothetical protein